MGLSSMKVHQFTRGSGLWRDDESSSSGLTLGVFKSLRPLNPKLTSSASTETCLTMNNISVSNSSSSSSSHVTPAFDLRSFIRPESCPIQLVSPDNKKDSPPQVNINYNFLIYVSYFMHTCYKTLAS